MKVRRGPKVVKSRHADLTDAVRAVEAALADVPAVEPRSAFRREYGPADQVVTRAELRGPGRARGGVDLHGDGSVRAWVGGITKEPSVPGPGESAYTALARALSE